MSSMFKFDFDLDDLTDSDEITQFNGSKHAKASLPLENTPLPKSQSHPNSHQDDPCIAIPINELILELPPFISYSNLKITPEVSIYKRELYDAKYQTIVNLAGEEEDSEEEEEAKEKVKQKDESKKDQRTLDSLQSTSDLIPGVYEGGFKTWECSLDLAANLGSIIDRLKTLFLNKQNHSNNGHTSLGNDDRHPHPCGKNFTILEVGCGTAIPTASLCFQLFSFILGLNRQVISGEAEGPSCDKGRSDLISNHKDNQEHPVLGIVLQDFNSDVLKLLTFPNILLAFYRAKRKAAENANIRTEESELLEEPINEEGEDLEITDELKTEFLSFLNSNGIQLTFIYGPWSTFRIPGTSTGSTDEEVRSRCEVIMSSETLYSIDSMPDFINLLINCKIDSNHCSEEYQESTILVASKSLYFGVGGGTHSFIKALEKYNAFVSFQDIQNQTLINSSGVSRVLMNVKFAS